MKLKSLKQIRNLKDKKVLLRVDFNVPLKDGVVKDDYRIKSVLPTINYLLEKEAKIIIIAHLGDPGGKVDEQLSLKPVAKHLSRILKRAVNFVPETVGYKAERETQKMVSGGIVFLENLRFNEGEATNDLKFAKRLAGLADVYINEAFSVCHRKQASVNAIRRCLPSYFGLQVIKEVSSLDKVLKPKKPLIVVIGGAKISTKAPIIKRLYKSSDHILVGGGLANNFFKHLKFEIGKSLVDDESAKDIKEFFKGKKLAEKIILPVDVVVCNRSKKPQVKKLKDVKKTDYIYDIGPESIDLFSKYIKKAETIIWNGPLGKFEDEPYKHGTLAVATIIAARATGRSYGVVGGGETVEALNKTKMQDYIDFVSTAGGAMLSYLGGLKMPGLK